METMMSWLPTVGYGCIGGLVVWFGPRAFTLARAVTSGWNKDNVKARLAICKDCSRVKQRDYVDPKGGLTTFLYCDDCKCGSHHIAELNTKLGFNNLKCPLGKWGPAVGMTVREGHDMLSARGAKERVDDKRERTNIMAGRDRNDNGPLVERPAAQSGLGRIEKGQPASRTEQAKAQLQQTEEAKAQRQKISDARRERGRAGRITIDAKHAEKKNRAIWADRQVPQAASETDAADKTNVTHAVPLAGTDHEGQILVDQKESSDGN